MNITVARNGQIIDNIAKSFQNLVNTNNGKFKSEKQAKFLLSKLNNKNSYISISQMYNNSFEREFFCNSEGVVKITQRNHKTNKNQIVWESSNKNNPNNTEHAKKFIAFLKKSIKNQQIRINDFLTDRVKNDFEKANYLDRYYESLKEKQEVLKNSENKLNDILSNKLIVIDNKGRTKPIENI